MLNQTHQIKETNITIDGTQLNQNQVTSLDIVNTLKRFYSSTTLVFDDLTDICSSIETNKSIMNIRLKDYKEKEYSLKIVITSMNKGGKHGRTIVLSGIDEATHKLIKTYKPKGYKETPADSIIKEYISQVSDLPVKSEEQYTASTYIVPGHQAFSKTMGKMQREHNFNVYKQRDQFVIESIASSFKNDSVGEYFYSENMTQVDNIQDINVVEDTFDVIKTPELDVFSYDELDKRKQNSSYNYNDSIENSSLGNDKREHEDIGTKLTFRDFGTGSDEIKGYYDNSLRAIFKIEALLSGDFEFDVGKLITVKYPNIKNENEFNKISGDYLIEEVHDKIEQGVYTCKLTLIRNKG